MPTLATLLATLVAIFFAIVALVSAAPPPERTFTIATCWTQAGCKGKASTTTGHKVEGHNLGAGCRSANVPYSGNNSRLCSNVNCLGQCTPTNGGCYTAKSGFWKSFCIND